MQRLRDKLTPSSRLKYLAWRGTGQRHDITLQLGTGEFIILRKPPSQDADIAHEMFVLDVYECPYPLQADQITNIIDVGANVGYSCIYWLRRFPHAHVTAFEPHPEHTKQIERQMQANAAAERVTVVPSAAGIAEGKLFLTNRGPESTLRPDWVENSIPVAVIDWFEHIGTTPIDLLKIDIEGGEYLLLSDARFENLKIGIFVLEWHNTSSVPGGRDWCVDRLQELGYEVKPGKIDYAPAGLLWARRRSVP